MLSPALSAASAALLHLPEPEVAAVAAWWRAQAADLSSVVAALRALPCGPDPTSGRLSASVAELGHAWADQLTQRARECTAVAHALEAALSEFAAVDASAGSSLAAHVGSRETPVRPHRRALPDRGSMSDGGS